jgi:hypothetical protein
MLNLLLNNEMLLVNVDIPSVCDMEGGLESIWKDRPIVSKSLLVKQIPMVDAIEERRLISNSLLIKQMIVIRSRTLFQMVR